MKNLVATLGDMTTVPPDVHDAGRRLARDLEDALGPVPCVVTYPGERRLSATVTLSLDVASGSLAVVGGPTMNGVRKAVVDHMVNLRRELESRDWQVPDCAFRSKIESGTGTCHLTIDLDAPEPPADGDA